MEIKGRRKKKKRAYSKLEKEVLLYVWYRCAKEYDKMQEDLVPRIIKAKLKVSERTLQRYLKDLVESGIMPKLQWTTITQRMPDWDAGRIFKYKELDLSKDEYVEKPVEISQNRSEHLDKLKRLSAAIDIYNDIEEVMYYNGVEIIFDPYDTKKKIKCFFKECVSVKTYREALKEKHPELLKDDRTLERDIKMLDHLFSSVGPGRTEFSFV